jgi:hypothetical protein
MRSADSLRRLWRYCVTLTAAKRVTIPHQVIEAGHRDMPTVIRGPRAFKAPHPFPKRHTGASNSAVQSRCEIASPDPALRHDAVERIAIASIFTRLLRHDAGDHQLRSLRGQLGDRSPVHPPAIRSDTRTFLFLTTTQWVLCPGPLPRTRSLPPPVPQARSPERRLCCDHPHGSSTERFLPLHDELEWLTN